MTTTETRPRRRFPWGVVAIVIALGLITAASWWFAGRKIWTDDHGLAVADGNVNLREVLWNAPTPLGDLFAQDQQQYEPSFSPDGAELYFVIGKPGHNADIYVSYRRFNQWTRAEPVKSINTNYDELGPRVTADGKYLLFYSDRPGGFGGYDIWAAARTKDGWGKPFNLGPHINSEYNEFTPDATPDGKHLIFATNRTAARREQAQPWRATIRENEVADFDLWIAELAEPASGGQSGAATQPAFASEQKTAPTTRPVPSIDAIEPAAPPTRSITAPATEPAAPLTRSATAPAFEPAPPELAFAEAHEIPGINTPYVEGASCMSPAGDFIYFASNRPGGRGKFDIWRSRVSPDWKFGPAENAGPAINTADNETDPALAFNGYRLIFSSDRGSESGVYRLYSSDSREVYATRQGRPLPQVGRSFWVFLLSLLALIPLLLMLRGLDSRRLGILQKCLLISVLIHVLFCLALSFMWVSQDVYHYARQQMGVEVAINLNPSAEMEVGTSIRRQSTAGDLPTGAPPQAVRITQTQLETVIAPGPVDVAVPRASAMNEPLIASAEMPRVAPTVRTEAFAAQPVAPRADLPRNEPLDIHVSAPHAVRAEEARPENQPAQIAAVRGASAVVAPAAVVSVPSAGASRSAPAPLPIEPGPVARRNIPAGALGEAASARADISPESATAPKVEISPAAAEKVAAKEVALARPSDAAAGAMSGPLQTPRAESVEGPKSEMTPSAAPIKPEGLPGNAPVVAAAVALQAAAPVVGGAAAPAVPSLVAQPDIDAPKSASAPRPVADGRQNAPTVEAANVGVARQEAAVASAARVGVDLAPARAAAAPSAGAPLAAGVAHTVKAIVAGPTTLPSVSVASAVGNGPDAPQVSLNAGAPAIAIPKTGAEERHLGRDTAEPSGLAAGPIADEHSAIGGAAAKVGAVMAPTRPDAGGSSALSAATGARVVIPGVAAPQASAPLASIPDAGDGPQVSLPQTSAALPSPRPAGAGAGPDAPLPTSVALAGRQSLHGTEGGGSKNVAVETPGPVLAGAKLPKESGTGLDPISARRHLTEVATSIAPKIDIGPLPTDIDPGKLNAPDSPFQLRAPEMHQPIIEKLGGTKESEDAVAKALFWLAENQEENGRWTMIFDSRRAKRQRSVHDTALTGLSVLAFLAQDHRPDKPGPYRETVSRALDFLLSAEKPDGDLRGDSPGPGAASSNMYDQGIATYAMAEAAIVSHDPRYVAGALKAADFIVRAQNENSGGWRYAPRESADTSVFGWQVMALHSAEQVGFVVPDRTREGINHYIAAATSGPRHMLAAYQPHGQPTPTMTAQMAFSRMLLGQQLSGAEMSDASAFLSRTPPTAGQADLYYWYYASLCMSQMQTPEWKQWNQKTRDTLIAMQKADGEHGGYWESNVRKGENVGRVFSTAMGALTLEVYYRYMPLQGRNAAGPGAK